MYSVEADEVALEQILTLPAAALESYAELAVTLELARWSGASYDPDRPDANLRTIAFGARSQGLGVYLILDDQRRVVVVRVAWMA